MRPVIAIAVTVMVLVLVACSSEKDGTGVPSCQPIGTFSVQDVRQSGTCPEDTQANTITVSAGASPTEILIEFQGVTGGCPATQLAGECKFQGKCDLTVIQPTDPARPTGTLQYSWTFDAAGLTGSSSLSMPPTATLTQGCVAEYSSSGPRR